MTPGLPGTGIGGLFYLLLVAFMPLREVFRVQRGRVDGRRWLVSGGLLVLAGGILAALWLEAWVLLEMLGLRQFSAEQATRMARAASVATLASLGLVMVALTVMRLVVRRPAPGASRCAAARVPACSAIQQRPDETVPVGPPRDTLGRRRPDLLSA